MPDLVTFKFNNRNGNITFEPKGEKKFMVQATDGLAMVDEDKAAFMRQHYLYNKVFFEVKKKSTSDLMREASDSATGGIDIRERIRKQAEEGKRLMDAQVLQERLAEAIPSEPKQKSNSMAEVLAEGKLPPPAPPKPKNPNRVASIQKAIAVRDANRAKRAAEAAAKEAEAGKIEEGVSV